MLKLGNFEISTFLAEGYKKLKVHSFLKFDLNASPYNPP